MCTRGKFFSEPLSPYHDFILSIYFTIPESETNFYINYSSFFGCKRHEDLNFLFISSELRDSSLLVKWNKWYIGLMKPIWIVTIAVVLSG